MIEDFLDWFVDFLNAIRCGIGDAVRILFLFLVAVISLPLWIIPFVFWFFFERGKEHDHPD